MCILCGCDYALKIEGIGPVTAYKFIKQYKTIENVLKYC
jgi:5'-3' exonuclease